MIILCCLFTSHTHTHESIHNNLGFQNHKIFQCVEVVTQYYAAAVCVPLQLSIDLRIRRKSNGSFFFGQKIHNIIYGHFITTPVPTYIIMVTAALHVLIVSGYCCMYVYGLHAEASG
uniref:Uncharacterized protein n=1 Tax=Schizaphis graminum TaxID=13262 RepID=A0A2S2PSB8_SCHGA